LALTALITRPEEDAAGLAELLTRRGINVVSEPLLTIAPVKDAGVDLNDVQALLFTSANGVRAFAALCPERELLVMTVGDSSARAARALGFSNVASAGGDVTSLAALVQERLNPIKGALFHAAGNVTAGDLGGALQSAGFDVRKVRLYDSRPARTLSPALKKRLSAAPPEMALFYSPRTADTFAALIVKAKLEKSLQGSIAYCLSRAIADKLHGLPWRAIRVAATPDQDALLAALDAEITGMKPGIKQGDDTMATAPESEAPPPSAPESLPEEDAPAAAGGRLKLIMGGVLLLIVAAVIALASVPWWASAVPEPYRAYLPFSAPSASDAPLADSPALKAMAADLVAQREALADLEQRLAGLTALTAEVQDRVAALEAAPSAAAPAGVDSEEVRSLRAANDEVAIMAADLAERVQAMEKSRVDAATVLGLSQRVSEAEKLAQEATTNKSNSSALILAAGQLKTAVDSGNPFAGELNAMTALGGDDVPVRQAAQTLQAYAAQGVITLAEVKSRFPAVARAVSQAAIAPQGDSWWSTALRRIMGQVTVRELDGSVAGDSPLAIIARAEAALAANQLAKAVAEVSTLTEASASAAASWLAAAQARASADAATSALVSAALAKSGG